MPQTPRIVTKASSASLDYEMEWAQPGNEWLGSGEVINSLQIVEATGGLAITSVTNTRSSAIFWVSGGVPGARYDVDVLITTSQDRIDERSISFMIEQRMYG